MDFLKFSSERWQPFWILLNLKICSTCPRWHQADFSLVWCTLPENAKKHLLCPKMRWSPKKGTFPLNYMVWLYQSINNGFFSLRIVLDSNDFISQHNQLCSFDKINVIYKYKNNHQNYSCNDVTFQIKGGQCQYARSWFCWLSLVASLVVPMSSSCHQVSTARPVICVLVLDFVLSSGKHSLKCHWCLGPTFLPDIK